jgi:hypothetical protein
MREISTQWSRIAVLVSAQWENRVLVLASWVVRRVECGSERDKATKKALKEGGRLSLYRRWSLAGGRSVHG